MCNCSDAEIDPIVSAMIGPKTRENYFASLNRDDSSRIVVTVLAWCQNSSTALLIEHFDIRAGN